MATKEEVKKLAALARISIPDAELPKFTKEFDAILAYVSQLETLDVPTKAVKDGSSGVTKVTLRKMADEKPALRNVMREDGEPHESGKYTKKIAAQFPAREGDYLEVKQIISHD